MKILISYLTLLGLVVAAGIVWITYPTSLESELRTFRSLPTETFKMLRDDAIAFARANASKGITIEAGPPTIERVRTAVQTGSITPGRERA
ncbi:TPA: hypothetical protein QEL30_000237 [Stenotrophomonas maltophilia]|nr:hypothetical protein [Stenotrophomonas maltophilia]